MSSIKDLARIVSDRNDIPVTEAEQFIVEMFNLLKEGLSLDELVKIKGLGTFRVQTIQERKSVNVNTGQTIIIDSHERISFTPDNSMKESVNKPFAHFETVPINEGVVFEDIEDVPEQTPQNIVEPTIEKQKEEQQPISTVKPAVKPVGLSIVEPVSVESVASSSSVESVETSAEESVTEPIVQPASIEIIEPVTEQTQETIVDTNTQIVSEAEIETSIEASSETIANPQPLADNKTTQQQISNTNNMDYLNPSKNDNSISLKTALFISVIVFVIGIIIGRFTADMTYDTIKEKIFPTEQVVVKDKAEFTAIDESDLAKESEQKQQNTAQKIDSARKIAAAEAEAKHEAALKKAKEELEAKEKAEQDKLAAKEKAAAEAKAAEANSSEAKKAATSQASNNYDADPRIKYGAYRIVGVQNTVTVKEGQTLASIAKAHLGPGMECYVEAINGVKEVKAGQKIKIPELQIKKKKKVQ